MRDDDDKISQKVQNEFSMYLEEYISNNSLKKVILAHFVNILVRLLNI